MEQMTERPVGIELRQQQESVRLGEDRDFQRLPVWWLPSGSALVIRLGEDCILARVQEETAEGFTCQELSRVGYDCELKLVTFRAFAYEPQGFVKILFSDLETMSCTVRRLYLKKKPRKS